MRTFLLAAALGATIGVVGMALVDLAVNGRYAMANRAEAGRRRRAQAKPVSPPRPDDGAPCQD
jgi:hypothetical protein